MKKNHEGLNVAVAANFAADKPRAKQLGDELNVALVDIASKDYTYLLVVSTDGLALHFPQHTFYKPLIIDFTHGRFGYRWQHLKRSNELLAKAVGIKKAYRPSIIDATAGFGQDSFIMACFGCKVLMLERSGILVTLLKDGLERLFNAKPELKNQLDLTLTHANAIDLLHNLKIAELPDVIYLDPMFPERQKSALVKKEMQVLQDLVGNDVDANQLLTLALKKATKRVVVKRPYHAAYLDDKKPTYSLTGKSIRFDIYQIVNVSSG